MLKRVLAILAILAAGAAYAADPEVLVTTGPTALFTTPPSRQAIEIQNLGPLPIYCRRGTSTGLAIGTGREIRSHGRWIVENGTVARNVYCVAAAAQTTTAGTIVQVADGFDGGDSPAWFDAAPLSTTAGGNRFACGVAGQAASLLQCAPVVAGMSYYITDIVAQSSTTTAGDYAIQSGTGTNCGSNTAVVFPPAPATTSSRYKAPANTSAPTVVALTTPIRVTSAHAVCMIGMATNTLNATISGYVAP